MCRTRHPMTSAEGRCVSILAEGPWKNAKHANNGICIGVNKPTNIYRMIDGVCQTSFPPVSCGVSDFGVAVVTFGV